MPYGSVHRGRACARPREVERMVTGSRSEEQSMPTLREESVPQKLRPTFDAITRITDGVCTQHLTDEYADLARKLTATLCRKRPSPLASGKVESWAAGILYALGTVNFLFDKRQTPHLRADDLCALLGVSTSTASAKAKTIRDLLDKIGRAHV